jgi:hypothetical protein
VTDQRLIADWLRQALNLQHGQPAFGMARTIGEERERCAKALARRWHIRVRILHRTDLERRRIQVWARGDR